MRTKEPAWERDDDAFDQKLEEWHQCDWVPWLRRQLTFPFRAERVEDMDRDLFERRGQANPCPVGCEVEVLGIGDGDFEPDFHGVIVDVRGDGNWRGAVPLQDLEVRPKTDPNFWPVREFVVWYANR
jgi:hypothetical protein